MTEPSTTQRDEPTPEKILMDWMDENGVELHGATPAMLVSVLRSTGYRKPRTITTVEELDALPNEAVIRGRGSVYEHDRGYFHCTDGGTVDASLVSLPVTVLHEPEAEVGA